ncbi:MAG: RNA methyltransferase [Bacilli bacterium]|nr:RNA methyltransferase [Bacilli bacterium]
MEITSVNNPLIKEMSKLHQKKYRDEMGLFLIEGYHMYEEANKLDIFEHVFTNDPAITGSKVIYVSRVVLEKLTKTQNPQNVVCVCRKLAEKELSDRVLILEEIQDPGNLGTLLRSALAFGFETVVLDNSVDVYNDKVLRSTQGAIFLLNLISMNTIDFMNLYQEYEYYGTSLHGSLLTEISYPQKFALILGNEGSGVSPTVLKMTKKNITISTQKVDSLNVGVAGSIIMHHYASYFDL